MNTPAYFETRFAPDPRRDVLWQALWRYYFSRIIAPGDCVLDLGAGYGSFINNVRARRRIAVDAWPGFVSLLDPGVESHVGDVTDLEFLRGDTVDFVFASNLFEHISQVDLATLLARLRTLLSPRGTLNVLQPNYRYAYREYFDDYTHRTVYSHVSLCDFLEAHGFAIQECHPRFLPLTIKSRVPVWAPLIGLYLVSPFKVMGKQMLVRAVVNGGRGTR
jgi:SAM-dependent methyltransferase